MRRLAQLTSLLGLCAGLFTVAPAALAQAWPSQKISIVVPYSAGGGHDAMARISPSDSRPGSARWCWSRTSRAPTA